MWKHNLDERYSQTDRRTIVAYTWLCVCVRGTASHDRKHKRATIFTLDRLGGF